MKDLEPNWDIMLNSVNHSISYTWNEYKKTYKSYLDSFAIVSGQITAIKGFEEKEKEAALLLKEIERLQECREKILNHDASFLE